MNTSSNESDFLKHLHNEKLKAQDARNKYVIRKLFFATALLGAGASNIANFNLSFLLYLVPYVTLTFDLYILAEDYSVKRIGGFLGAKSIDIIEKEWESWISKNRDPFAPFSMPLLTTLVSIASFLVLSKNAPKIQHEYFLWLWLTTAVILSWILFGIYVLYLRRRILRRLEFIQDCNYQPSLTDTIKNLRQLVQNADYVLNRKIYEEIQNYFRLCLEYPNILINLKALAPEYEKKEFLKCVNSAGESVCKIEEIVKSFKELNKQHPEFENWFKVDRESNNAINKSTLLIARWLCHLLGFRHNSVHLFIDHPTQTDYTFVQVRGLHKFESPGRFDLPTAGHVVEMESLENALIKELKEELNLDRKDIDNLKEIDSYEYIEKSNSSNIKNVEFRSIFKCSLKIESLSKIEFKDNEVAALSIFLISELQKFITVFPSSIATGLKESFPRYLNKNKELISIERC